MLYPPQTPLVDSTPRDSPSKTKLGGDMMLGLGQHQAFDQQHAQPFVICFHRGQYGTNLLWALYSFCQSFYPSNPSAV